MQKTIIRKLFYAIRRVMLFIRAAADNELSNRVEQKNLEIFYKSLYRQGYLQEVADTGFRLYSGGDEDGVLHYIFSIIGTTTRICAEISYPSPLGGNTTNLLRNRDWWGILVCAKEKERREVERYYSAKNCWPPVVRQAWVTAENVNSIITDGLVALDRDTELDLLSIDIDGVDYWIWKALNHKPRVVIIEYHDVFTTESVTVPYDPDFVRDISKPDYRSASLPALIKLGKEKGYHLVGTVEPCNAVFIRNDISILPEIELTDHSLYHTPDRLERLDKVKNMNWMEI